MAIDFEAEGLLDGVSQQSAREARLVLLRELAEAGVPAEELRRAVAENRLAMLPVERALAGGEARYSLGEVAEHSGLEPAFLESVWRALGAPLAEAGDRAYNAEDLEAAINISRIRGAGLPDEGIVEIARVLGSGMATLAAAIGSVFGDAFLRAGDTERDVGARYGEATHELLPLLAPALLHALRIHQRAVARQAAVGSSELASGRLPGAVEITICFADLVGFTKLGEVVPADELGALAERFARLTLELVAPPVRLVKTIGDAVMLVSRDPDALLGAVLGLLDAVTVAGDDFPAVHAGVAYGPALSRAGDWYGSSVNLASRVADFARPGSVVAAEALREAAGGDYRWSFAGRHRLKGIREPVTLLRVRHPEPEPS